MRSLRLCFAVAAWLLSIALLSAQTITVRFPAARSAKPLDGRLLLLLSNDPSAEPRMQIDETRKSQMVFGITVGGWKPDSPHTAGDAARGHPRASQKDVPPASIYDSRVAVLNIYETFHRADGKTIKARARPRRGPALESCAG